ncbi:MAG: site-2 protease family protein [Bacilli bacterium]|nr:site-2 protease family protein [Bacilli bacterium]
MNGILSWIITIILFIVSLAALITIHELGHFAMAKLFNVYCFEFSIGFGPKLLRKKRKNGETYFALRAIPLGGYVSMFGEDTAGEFGDLQIPPERSIEGIKKWKKAIVLSAGIIMNVFLALTIFSVSNLCFKQTAFTTSFGVTENSLAYNLGVRENDKLIIMGPEATESDTYSPKLLRNDEDTEAYGYLIDNQVVMGGYHYAALYYPTTNRKDTVLTDAIYLYRAYTKEEIEASEELKLPKVFNIWDERDSSLDYYPVFKKGNESTKLIFNEETSFELHLNYLENADSETPTLKTVTLPITTSKTKNGVVLSDAGLTLKLAKYWLPFKERLGNVFRDFGEASIAVFKGLGSLFTGGLKNMSGVVGMLQITATYVSYRTAADYLYLWGLISVNLAIFNLLPFPGLDGWQLLVTIIEGISRKKIPSKLKSIMSFIGMALLFTLMIAIVVIDILRWVGIAL